VDWLYNHTQNLSNLSLSHYLGPRPPMHPDSVPDLGDIQIIYLLSYLLDLKLLTDSADTTLSGKLVTVHSIIDRQTDRWQYDGNSWSSACSSMVI